LYDHHSQKKYGSSHAGNTKQLASVAGEGVAAALASCEHLRGHNVLSMEAMLVDKSIVV
jgi:hypothetical protein